MTVNTYFILQQLKDYVRKLERGDADSSGSTLRTAGIVFLVIAVVVTLGGALMLLLPDVRAKITDAQFLDWQPLD
jgi:hypothetical protein